MRSLKALVLSLATLGVFCISPGRSAVSPATVPPGFTVTPVAAPLAQPTAMTFAPDGRLLICLQGGTLRLVKGGVLLDRPFLTLTVDGAGERGLLGVALDPAFSANQYVYVYYTVKAAPVHNRVSRFTAAGDTVVAGSELVLLDLNNLTGATNHNGGAIHFGPDGKLYVAVGENATPSNSQTTANLLGKILRMNPDGSIPTDNPFYNSASGQNRLIWALGLRNPFTFAFQPGTGRMLINDVGAGSWEEINPGVAGANYGWPATEGYTTNSSYISPIHAYPHGNGTSAGNCIAGGAFYNPTVELFPVAFRGLYFYADYTNNWIRTLRLTDSASTLFATNIPQPVDLQVGPDGALYYLARGSGGSVAAIRYSTTSVGGEATETPAVYRLEQNYPNPFNPTTVVSCQWPVASDVALVVYDVLGRQVAILARGRYPAGRHDFTFDARNLPSGVYFVRLISGGFTQTRKMLLTM